MALQHILQKIVSEAEESAQSIAQSMQQRIQELEQKTDHEIGAANERLKQETAERIQGMDRKIASHVEHEAKAQESALKAEILEKVKTATLTHMGALPEKEQQKILVSLLRQIDDDGVVHPAKGQHKMLEQAMHAAQKTFKLEAEADISGGFLFVGKKMDIDASFETLLATEVFPKVEVSLSEHLFA